MGIYDDLLQGGAGQDFLQDPQAAPEVEYMPGLDGEEWQEPGQLDPEPGKNVVDKSEADKIADDPRYNTTLSGPEEEAKYQIWKQQNFPNDSGYDYDLRGAYKAGMQPDPVTGHGDDKFKKPNHPTFSEFSQYAPLAPERAGTWDGDTYVPAAELQRRTGVEYMPAMDDPYDGSDIQDQPKDYWKTTKNVIAHDPSVLGLMSAARATGGGLEMLGSLLESYGDPVVVRTIGEKARAAGKSFQDYVTEHMPEDYKKSAEKMFTDLSSESALRDPMSWVNGLYSQLPYMVAGVLGGEAAAGGLMVAGVKKAAAVVGGYAIAEGALSAGDAAQSAGQAADEAGLSPEQRRKAERVASISAVPMGLITGAVLGKVFHGGAGGPAATVAATIGEQAVDEGGDQAAAEVGKTSVGLPFDWGAVAESAVQGGLMGGPFGSAIALRNRGIEKERKAADDEATAKADADAAAVRAEAQRVQAEQAAEAEAKRVQAEHEHILRLNRQEEAEGWAQAPQGPSESAPVAGAQRPGPAPYGPPRPGTATDFVAGQDPNTRTAAAREQLAVAIVQQRLDMVDTQDAVEAAGDDKAKRAKHVGQFRAQQERLVSMEAEFARYNQQQGFALPEQQPGYEAPAQNIPAGNQPAPNPVPADPGQGMDATRAYAEVIRRMDELRPQITAVKDNPEVRQELVEQFRELNMHAVALRNQLDGEAPSGKEGTAVSSTPSAPLAVAGPPAAAGALPPPPLRLAPPSAADLGLNQGRPEKSIPLGTTERAALSPKAAEQTRRAPEVHAATVADLEAKLDSLRAKLGEQRNPSARAKQVGEFRKLTKDYNAAVALLNDAVKKRDALGGASQEQQPLGGLQGGQAGTAGKTDVDYAALAAKLDATMPAVAEDSVPLAPRVDPSRVLTVEPPPPPLLKVERDSIARSQRSKAGAATKAARKAAALHEAGQQPEPAANPESPYVGPDIQQPSTVDGQASAPPQPAPLQALPTQASRATASMGAELQALRDRFPAPEPQSPSETEAAPQDGPPEAQGAPSGAEAVPEAPRTTPKPQGAVRASPGLPLPPSEIEAAKRRNPQTQGEFLEVVQDLPKVKASIDQQLGQENKEEQLPDPTQPPHKVPEPQDPPMGVLQTAAMLGGKVTVHTATAPRNVLARLLAKGPVNVTDALAHLQANLKLDGKPKMVRLIDQLARAFPATNDKPSSVMVENRALTHGFQGLYNPKTDIISLDLDQAEDPLEAVLHEIVHAAAIVKSRTNPEFKRELQRLTLEAKSRWEDNGLLPDAREVPGFANHEEFLSHALTNTAFQDQLAALYKTGEDGGAPSQFSSWALLRNRLANRLGFAHVQPERPLFEALLEFIPDGGFLQDAPNRAAVLAELDRLGFADANALMNRFRSILRTPSPPAASGLVAPNGRVTEWLAKQYTAGMIVNSFGKFGRTFYNKATGTVEKLTGSLDEWARLIELKGGFAMEEKAKGSKIVEVFKDALAGSPNSRLGELMKLSRLYQMDASLPSNHIANLPGSLRPGSTGAHAELDRIWQGLSQAERDTYLLVRDHGDAIRYEHINQMMTHRMREMVDEAAGNALDQFIRSRPKNTSAIGQSYGIDLSYAPILTGAEIDAQVTALVPTTGTSMSGRTYSKKEQDRVRAALHDVHDIIKGSPGPYFPLRRHGRYFVAMKSEKQTRNMTPAELDKLVTDDRNALGTLMHEATPLPGGKLKVTYWHEAVEGYETERESKEAHRQIDAEWRAAARVDGRVIPADGSKYGLKRDNVYDSAGLRSDSVDALRRSLHAALDKNLGKGAGKIASDAALDWFLDKLPSTSVRKSQMKARLVAGASDDMLRAYADYVQGSAFLQAQLVYGHRINRVLTKDLPEDVARMRAAGAGAQAAKQANDLQFLGNQLQDRQEAFMETASLDRDANGIKKLWARTPNIAAAWLLTGFGSMAANMTQVPVMSLSHLGARHGVPAASAALLGAYRDTMPEIAAEAGKDFGRGVVRSPAAAKAIRAGRATPSIRDPKKSVVDRVMDGLSDPLEKQFVAEMARNRRLDFGMVADIQSIASADGKLFNAITYLSDAAFVLPQAVETLNRSVTALASYRLNRAKFQKSNPGQPITPDVFQTLVDQALYDVDQTQFNYGRENKSPLMQNEWLRAGMVFKNFAFHTVYAIGHNLAQAMNAETKEERVVASKFLAGFGAMTFLASGAMGIASFEPIYAAVALLMSLFGSDDKDPEELLRQHMQDMPDWLRGMALHGVPYGLGLDATRLGLSQVLPLTDIVKAMRDPQTGKEEVFAQLGKAMAGAPGSIIADLWTGFSDIAHGEFAKGAQEITPKAFAINDTVRMLNYASHGLLDTKGDQIATPAELGLGSMLVRFLGFNPSKVTEAQSQRAAVHSRIARYDAQRQELIDGFVDQALKQGDTADEIAAVVKWNQTHPAQRITKESLLGSAKRRATRTAQVARFGMPAGSKSDYMVMQELDPLYGSGLVGPPPE